MYKIITINIIEDQIHNYEGKQIYLYNNFVSNNVIDLGKIYSHNVLHF